MNWTGLEHGLRKAQFRKSIERQISSSHIANSHLLISSEFGSELEEIFNLIADDDMGKQPMRLKAVVYALSPFQQKVMSGLWHDLPTKIHHKISENWISTILLLGPLVGTHSSVLPLSFYYSSLISCLLMACEDQIFVLIFIGGYVRV